VELVVEEIECLGEDLQVFALSEVDAAGEAQIDVVEVSVAEGVASKEWKASLSSSAHESKAPAQVVMGASLLTSSLKGLPVEIYWATVSLQKTLPEVMQIGYLREIVP
jgi:hypothetical protein